MRLSLAIFILTFSLGPGKPAPVLAEERILEVQSENGVTLSTTLRLPGAEPIDAPGVLLIAGSGPQNRDASDIKAGYAPHRQWADEFAREGIATLRYDERGVGSSNGDWASMTFSEHVADIVRLIAAFRDQEGVDTERLFLLGHSEGALLAAAAANEIDVSGLILLSGPARPLADIIDEQARANTPQEGLSESAFDEAVERTRKAFLERASKVPSISSLLEVDPEALLSPIDAPILVLHGSEDSQVQPDNAAVMARIAVEGGNDDIRMHIVPELGHLLISADDPARGLSAEVIMPVVRWTVDQADLETPRDPRQQQRRGASCIGIHLAERCIGYVPGR